MGTPYPSPKLARGSYARSMEIAEALLALIAACIGFALLARRARVPYAVILVVGGMALAFIPGLPAVTLDPELALAFLVPPLLQASAWRTRQVWSAAVGCWSLGVSNSGTGRFGRVPGSIGSNPIGFTPNGRSSNPTAS